MVPSGFKVIPAGIEPVARVAEVAGPPVVIVGVTVRGVSSTPTPSGYRASMGSAPGSFTVIVTVREAQPSVLQSFTVTVYTPTVVGVPVIDPSGLRLMPGGKLPPVRLALVIGPPVLVGMTERGVPTVVVSSLYSGFGGLPVTVTVTFAVSREPGPQGAVTVSV
jgi:hypothetical protein